MNTPLIIIGAGGHAKVVIDTIRQSGGQIRGIVEKQAKPNSGMLMDIPILGSDAVVFSSSPDDLMLVNAIGSVKGTSLRARVFNLFKDKGFSFASICHPFTVIANDGEYGEGLQVMAGAIIQPGCNIGRNVLINTAAIIDHDTSIGDHVHIAPGVRCSGGVSIGDGTHVGTGAMIRQGIKIGRNCVIAVGAVVVKDVPDNCCAKGVPAKMEVLL